MFHLFPFDLFSYKKNVISPCPLGVQIPWLLCLIAGLLQFPTQVSTSDFPLCQCPLCVCLKHTWLSALRVMMLHSSSSDPSRVSSLVQLSQLIQVPLKYLSPRVFFLYIWPTASFSDFRVLHSLFITVCVCFSPLYHCLSFLPVHLHESLCSSSIVFILQN